MSSRIPFWRRGPKALPRERRRHEEEQAEGVPQAKRAAIERGLDKRNDTGHRLGLLTIVTYCANSKRLHLREPTPSETASRRNAKDPRGSRHGRP